MSILRRAEVNRLAGTFTANQTTEVVVADVAINEDSVVLISLNTVGGTPAGQPFLSSRTVGTSFGVKAATGDTSVYNYVIL